jgi:N-acetyl-gamma-glutamyl-phosphate reductase
MVEVAVVGAGGYTGFELLKLLALHPVFKIGRMFGTKSGRIEGIYPGLRGVVEGEIFPAEVEEIGKFELVFLAVPHKTAMEFVPRLLERGCKVVDFSADYRLKRENYEKFYCPHRDPANLEKAVYGLPEFYRSQISTAQLVANPGCYPTAALLGLKPFLPYIEGGVFIDAKSGVSGAGKKLSETTHFCSVNENFHPYNPIKHRHSVEIEEKSGVKVTFVPHLLPITRGMEVSIFARLNSEVGERWNPSEVARQFYRRERFVRVMEQPVGVKQVAGTHFCDLFASRNGDHLYVNVVIDNLLRGASSQALANANLMMGLPEEMGLPLYPSLP